MSAVTMPTGNSMGAITVRDDQVARHQKRRAEAQRGGHDQPMIGADEQPHQVRHDDADKADGPADGDRGAGGERRAEKRESLHAQHVHASAGRVVVAKRQHVQRPRQPQEECRMATTSIGSAATSGW